MAEEHDPTEHIQEEIHERAHGEGEEERGGAGRKWIGWAALTAALFAALAAIGGSQASTHLTRSSRTQIESNDQWLNFDSQSIKKNMMLMKIDLLRAGGHEPAAADLNKPREYEKQGARAQEDAKRLAELSEKELQTSETLEHAVTLFHISIAVVAIAVLTRRKGFWYASVVSGAAGAVFLVLGLARAPAAASEHPKEEAMAVEHHGETAPAGTQEGAGH